MAAVLRDWLAGTIENELKLAIERYQAQSVANDGLANHQASEDLLKRVKVEGDSEAYVASQAEAKPERKYTNDGSNLRVECPLDNTVPRWVQIIKFITFQGAIQAFVSDAHTIVKVIFSSDAVKDFTRKKGKPLTEGTRGGVMHINQYEIVATTFGASVGHVSLRIQNFDYKGGITNPTIGRPIAIEENFEISTLLPRIGDLLGAKRAESDTHVSNGPGSVFSSDVNNNTINSDPTIADVVGRNRVSVLASQAIPTREKHTRKPPHRRSEVEVMGGVNLGAPIGAGRAALGSDARQVNATRKEMAENLLRVLRPMISESKSLEEPRLASPGISKLLFAAEPTVSSTGLKELSPPHSRKPAENSINLSVDGRAPSTPSAISTEQQDFNDKSSAQERSPVLKQHADAEVDCKAPFDVKPMAFDIGAATVTDIARQVEFHGGDFSFVHRFTSEFTASKIEEDAILKRPESWQHPEVGYRFVPPNLPGDVLAVLNSLAEKRAKNRLLPQSDEHQLSCGINNVNPSQQSMEILNTERDLAEEEIDNPSSFGTLSGSEWLPTQPTNRPSRKHVDELPLDSSANVIVQSSCSPKAWTSVMDGSANMVTSHGLGPRGRHPETNGKSPGVENIGCFDTDRHSDQEEQNSETQQRMQPVDKKDTNIPSSPPVPNHRSTQSISSEINDSHESRSQDHVSDMEMDVPLALGEDSDRPMQYGSLASKSFPPDTRHDRAKTQVAETPYTRTRSDNSARRGPPHTPWTAPQQQRNSWQSSQDSQKKPALYPDTYVPGTFYSDQYVAPQKLHENVMGADGALSSDPPESTADDIVGKQLRDEIKAASQRSNKVFLANKFNSSPPAGFDEFSLVEGRPKFGNEEKPHHLHSKDAKRKAYFPPPPNGPLKDVKRARLQDETPSHDTPAAGDLNVAARTSRNEFTRNAMKSVETTAKAPLDQTTSRTTLVHRGGSSSDNIEMHDTMETIAQNSPSRSQLTMSTMVNQPRTNELALSNIERGRQPIRPPNQSQAETARSTQSRNTTNITFTQTPTSNLDIFRKFSDSYPNYTGDMKHFLGLCRTISRLSKDGRMQHKTLWDDFIIRHKTHYSQYLRQCMDEGESPMPYERFYIDKIDEPMHNLRIMNPANLNEALAQHDMESFAISKRVEGSRHIARSSSSDSSASSRSPKRPGTRPITTPSRFDRRPAPMLRKRQRGDSWRPQYPRNPVSVPPSLTPGSIESRAPVTRNNPAATPSQKAARPLPWSESAESSKLKPSSSPIRRSTRKSHLEQRTDQSKTTTITTNPIAIDRASPLPMEARHIHKIENTSPRAPTLDSADLSDNEWWKDESTPFKDWARQYASLKVFNGSLGQGSGRNVLTPRMKSLNVLAWRL